MDLASTSQPVATSSPASGRSYRPRLVDDSGPRQTGGAVKTHKLIIAALACAVVIPVAFVIQMLIGR